MAQNEPRYYLVYDLETTPRLYDSFSESQQEYIVRGANTEEERIKKLGEMALSPLTGKIICIGLQLMETLEDGSYILKKKKAFAVDELKQEPQLKQLESGAECELMSEKEIIKNFWSIFQKEDYRNVHLITFNGRNFDAPFLMLRSAILNIKPTRNLMTGTKFTYPLHTDLLDELTYFNPGPYGATKRFNFDFYTREFGITSPKSAGIDGSKVSEFYNEGKILEIAEYCLRDVKATWELFLKWKEFLRW
ncbi:MAG: 3'-5' exonuclease [Bacteroidetes bacterium]|nr:MAG: 3'-5' exonuclease [Bacteroidota bacterium]